MSDNQEALSDDLKSQISNLMDASPSEDMAQKWLNTNDEPDLGKELSNDPAVKTEPETKPETKPEIETPPETTETTGPKVYQSLKEFEADGNDPDFYQGPKAFIQSQEDIRKAKEVKSQRNETNELLLQIQRTQEQQEQRHQDELTAQRATLEEQVKLADADDDLAAYKLAENKLAENKLRSTPLQEEPAQAQYIEPAEYRALRAQDERLNKSSPKFDPLYNMAFEQTANRLAMAKTNLEKRELYGHERQEIIDEVKGQMDRSQYNQKQQTTNPNRLRQSAVNTPSGATVNSDPMGKMTEVHKTLYAKWSKGSEYQQQMATRMLEKYK